MISESWRELLLVDGMVSRLSGEWGAFSDFLDDSGGELERPPEIRKPRSSFIAVEEMKMGDFPLDEDPSNDEQERDVTIRRTLEQASHLISAAESVVIHREDLILAFEDAFHSLELLRSLELSSPTSGEQVVVGGENVTLRRLLEQSRQCVDESRSVVERGEDIRCAADDLEVAVQLLCAVRRRRLQD